MQLGLPFDAAPVLPAVSAPPVAAPLELYFVRHRRARRYVVRVERDGRVRVTIPRGGSRRDAAAFAERSMGWIRRQLLRPRPAGLEPDEERRLRRVARELLPARLHDLAREHGLEVSRVTIRNQHARWGSCGRDGHICLNWRLVRMPDWVRDYVLIHELMHLRRMDHSPRYWSYVAAACPGYEDARRWLRAHGRELA